jgi:ATP-dependent DNA helicase RecG
LDFRPIPQVKKKQAFRAKFPETRPKVKILMAMDLSTPITSIPRIIKPQIAALKKLGINSVQDLLFYFPYKYLDFSKLVKIKDIKPGENITIRGKIKSIQSRFSFHGRLSLAEAAVSDDTGSIKVVWFNQGYLAKTLQKGEDIFLAGTAEYYKTSLQITNPIYEKVSDFPIHTSRLVPVYHLTQNIYPKTFRNVIAQVLPLAKMVTDILPKAIMKRHQLPGISAAINFAHFPENRTQIQEAKKRLVFEEIFITQLGAQKYKLEIAKKQSYAIAFNQALVKKFVNTLPFTLTAEQKKTAWEILQDVEKPLPMNRLLEGDVGSGKTLVALIAALQVLSAGLQVVFLAPTEILARQHFDTARKYLGSKIKKFKICLLTNHYAKIDEDDIPKSRLQSLLSEGMPGLFIGTHALIAEKVKFKDLALVIVDEQHRFGVEQRAALIQNNKRVPHLLSLTATPIPRTLQLAFYGELDISQIKSKPEGRKPIITRLVNQANRQKAYEFIAEQVRFGWQAFVITPLIEENDKLGVKAAITEVKNMKSLFPKFKIGLMHGRLKGEEKEQVMKDFLANEINILVSTSVVEVGVDVPNASVCVIEGAERFGLAQLHQFRGRVGRAEHQSYCLLFTESQNQESLQRLESFTKINDGFELSELDLKLRGFGEIFGSAQSGINFKYFNPSYISLIEPARQEALSLLKDDPELLQNPLLKEKIQDKVIHFE